MFDNVCLVCNLFECTEELVHHDRFQIYDLYIHMFYTVTLVWGPSQLQHCPVEC